MNTKRWMRNLLREIPELSHLFQLPMNSEFWKNHLLFPIEMDLEVLQLELNILTSNNRLKSLNFPFFRLLVHHLSSACFLVLEKQQNSPLTLWTVRNLLIQLFGSDDLELISSFIKHNNFNSIHEEKEECQQLNELEFQKRKELLINMFTNENQIVSILKKL